MWASERGPIATRKRRAFTLVELLVVMTLLVLASVVVIPGFLRFQHGSQLRTAARRTLALAGEARGLAVARDTVAMLSYDRAAHGLRLQLAPPEDVAPDGGAQGQQAPPAERPTSDMRLLEYPLDVEVTLEGGDPEAGGVLRFYGDGRADGALIRLEREGFDPILLSVNPRTGRISIVDAPPAPM